MFLRQAPALVFGLLSQLSVTALAQVQAAPREKMPRVDVAACELLASAWSLSDEARYFVPPPVAALNKEIFIRAGQERVRGELLGTVHLEGRGDLKAARFVSGGTCYSDTITLAKPLARSVDYISAVADSSDLDVSPDPEEAVRWSGWGASDQLVRLNGRIYKTRGWFADPVSGRGSDARKLRMLFAARGDAWVPVCAFDTVRSHYRTSSLEGACGNLASGQVNAWGTQPGDEKNRFFLTHAGSNSGGIWVNVRSHDSSAGCGGVQSWLYNEDEFAGRSMAEILTRGAPNTFALNGISPNVVNRDALLRELFDAYPIDGQRTTGAYGPAFSSFHLLMESTDSGTVVIRPGEIDRRYPRMDLEVLGAKGGKVQGACRAQLVSRAWVKYWYAEAKRDGGR